ncbi:TonB-dependent hemoglobin/transferrin/lactoferrin family receptor [Sansalvadorimonas verongulae]|uniref:TonB-dependent hemoglobin/transferrin/lactoferrin family receptor n=1 Tax=Sansalvadorimonas verongulae TaxID=2172824 RepID=UPI0018AD164C|nr:TonB-dependent hemoglobin/transferrin/lactoferrin family receptor [Sansalvadorimonas verongulae]
MNFRPTLLAVSVMATTAAWAAETPTTMLDQVTVTATRTEKQIKDVAGSVSVKDSEQLDREMARNIKDMMRYEPGIEVGTNQRGGSEGFNIRGMDANRVKIMVDGIDQSQQFDPGYGFISSQRNFIDIDSLKAIEVVKGPSSSLYGSDAIGGTVAYITKNPADYLKAEGDDSHASIKSAYSSVDKGFTNTFTAANRSGDLDTMVVYTRRDAHETKNYEGSNVYGPDRGKVNPNDNRSNNILAKVQYQINDSHRVGLTVEHLNSKSDSKLKSMDLYNNGAPHNASASDESERTRVGIFHEWDLNSAFADLVKWNLDWQKTEKSQNTFMPAYVLTMRPGVSFTYNDRIKDYSYTENSLSLSTQLEKAFSLAGLEHNVVYGFSASRTDTQNNNTTIDLADNTVTKENYIPKVDAKKYGLFVQDEIQVTDRLTVTPGLRYDRYEYNPSGNHTFNSQDVTDVTNSKVTGRLGTVYKLTENLNLFAQYSQGFKNPGFYEMYFYRNGGTYKAIPNPNLKPEESDSYEIGLRGDGSLGSYEVTSFYNKYDNFIDSVTDRSNSSFPDGISSYQNVNKAEIKGLELRGELWLDSAINAPEGTSLKGSLSYAKGKDTANNKPLNSVAPLKAVIGLGYDAPSETWGGDVALTLVKGKSKSDIDESGLRQGKKQFTPAGYGVVDMTTYYKPVEDLTLRAGLFNVTDKKYTLWDDVRGMTTDQQGLDRYTQPGRNVSVSATYVF